MNDENYNDTDWGSPCGSDGCGEPDDILSCIPMPCGCCRVLRKLRAPAVRLRWRIDKQTIPDLDREQTEPTADAAGTGASAGQSGGCDGADGTSTMRGQCTVRLFDLCLVSGTMLLLCGIASCCRRLCRKTV